MIKITLPNNNLPERNYIIDILFNEFLGLNYEVKVSTEKVKDISEIKLKNGARIIFEDHFFNNHPEPKKYLKLENIPSHVAYAKNEFTSEEDIPVIHGSSKLETFENKIICGIDIFASCFFMLTRWEEYVNKKKDSHNRFPAYESLAQKNGFLDRPIVNEYVEMLKNMILFLDNKSSFKKQKFEYVLTHDVDHINKWDSFKKFFRHLAGDLIQRKSVIEFFKTIVFFVKVKMRLVNDPYDTFDYFMRISDELGVQSHFFFMATGGTSFDNRYKTDDEKVLNLVRKIKKRKHLIGIHPTYNAYNDFERLKSEREELEKNFGLQITFGREHYLRFEVPRTWQIWEDNNLKWDSTCSYADKEGFRCGVCYEYSVFNIITRKKLNLKEKPLIVMDGSLSSQKEMTVSIMKERILNLIEKVRKHNGSFVFLWHNSSFNVKEWRSYNKVYEEVLMK